MSKLPRNKATYATVDFSKPLQFKETPSNDCFGREWDPTSRDCGVCADMDVCGVYFAEKLKKQTEAINKQAEEKEEYFLDQTDFSLINEEALRKIVITRAKSKEGIEVEELFDAVKTKSKCSDDVAVVEWIKRFLKKDSNLYTRNGKILLKNG